MSVATVTTEEPKVDIKPDNSYDMAWKIHAAQVDWTGKVDAKATFTFTLESAALTVVMALSVKDRTFYLIDSNLERWLYWGGLVSLLVGAAFALAVVFPRLRRRKVKKESPDNYIYFGHLKSWDATNLAQTLRSTDHVEVVAQQCINMAGISWRKHRHVQNAMIFGGIGIAALVLCGSLCTATRDAGTAEVPVVVVETASSGPTGDVEAPVESAPWPAVSIFDLLSR